MILRLMLDVSSSVFAGFLFMFDVSLLGLAEIQLMFVNNGGQRVITCSLHQSHVTPTVADSDILDTSCFEDMVETHECSTEDLKNEPGTASCTCVESGTRTLLKPCTLTVLESYSV